MAKANITQLKTALAQQVHDEERTTPKGAVRDEHTVPEFLVAILKEIKSSFFPKLDRFDSEEEVWRMGGRTSWIDLLSIDGLDVRGKKLYVSLTLHRNGDVMYTTEAEAKSANLIISPKTWKGEKAGFKTLVRSNEGESAEDIMRHIQRLFS